MKKDNKVFVIFILIILVYGLMHYFDGIGKFDFPQQYSDFGLGIVALALFFHKKFTKYSFLLITLGFSLFYLLASTKGFDLIDKSAFVLLKNMSLIAFALMALWDLNKGRYKSLKWELGLLSLLIIGFFALRIADFDWAMSKDYSFYKNAIGFVLVAWILKRNVSKSSFTTPLKRVVIVIGLSFFIELMSYLVRL
jgi:hypothetical protein